MRVIIKDSLKMKNKGFYFLDSCEHMDIIDTIIHYRKSLINEIENVNISNLIYDWTRVDVGFKKEGVQYKNDDTILIVAYDNKKNLGVENLNFYQAKFFYNRKMIESEIIQFYKIQKEYILKLNAGENKRTLSFLERKAGMHIEKHLSNKRFKILDKKNIGDHIENWFLLNFDEVLSELLILENKTH